MRALWAMVQAGAHYYCTPSAALDNVYYVYRDEVQVHVADSEDEALEWANADALERELNAGN